MSKGVKIPYDEAMRIAKLYFYDLGLLRHTRKIAIVGSLRRKAEWIGDIDFQIHSSPSRVRKFFRKFGWACENNGMHRQIFYSASTLPKINIFYADDTNWGASLMHNTGPSRYNIRKRAMIKRKGWLLNQYGLYKPVGDMEDDEWEDTSVGVDDDIFEDSGPMRLVASITEKDIYGAMGWDYCKPEDRK